MSLVSTELEASVSTEVGPQPSVAMSPGQLARRRFFSDKKTVIAAGVVSLYFLLALLGPVLVKTHVLDPWTQHLDLMNDLSLPSGHFGGVSWSHPFGIEPGIGRDVLSRAWYGITFSVFIALAASLMSLVIGVVLGIIAGATGGWVDAVIGRFIDLMLSFPQQLMLISLSSIFVFFIENSMGVSSDLWAHSIYVVAVMSLFGWMSTARIVRGQVLSLREREFIQAAQLFGASRPRIWFKEILPNLWAPILVTFTLMLPAYISTEAALAYLGVSVAPPTPTLGNILSDSTDYATADPTYFILPALLIIIIVVAFNLLGDGLRDALDPKGHR